MKKRGKARTRDLADPHETAPQEYAASDLAPTADKKSSTAADEFLTQCRRHIGESWIPLQSSTLAHWRTKRRRNCPQSRLHVRFICIAAAALVAGKVKGRLTENRI
jgi:hypothetical protein